MDETVLTASEALKEVLLPSAKDAAAMVSRLAALKGASYITADGDVLSAFDYEKECEYLKGMLRAYIEAHGPLYVEGVGEQRLQERSGPWSWDVKGLAEGDPLTFARLLELGALTINDKIATALEQGGQVTMFRKWGFRGAATPALIVKK